jgi:chemotaxis protein MotB
LAKAGRNKGGVIIIKKEDVAEDRHHGGAWKVAYADFVTAMMAFFLLMWLLNATTEEQRKGLADYFSPAGSSSHKTSGNGSPFGGHTPFDAGSLVSDRGAQTIKPGKATAMVAPDDADADNSQQLIAPRLIEDDGDPASAQLSRTADGGSASGARASAGASPARRDAGQGPAQSAIDPAADPAAALAAAAARAERAARAASDARERAAMGRAAEQIREAVQADPALAALARQLSIDITPKGLRIQLLDEDGRPMFNLGSATLIDRARLLLLKVAPILAQLSEPIAITGHTDAAPYHGGDRTNWELSSDRANATRRLLVEAGVQEDRFRSVTGAADRDPLLPADPLAAANRRIAIVVLRTHGAAPATPGAPPAGAPLASVPPTIVPPTGVQSTGVPSAVVGPGAPAGALYGGPSPAIVPGAIAPATPDAAASPGRDGTR